MLNLADPGVSRISRRFLTAAQETAAKTNLISLLAISPGISYKVRLIKAAASSLKEMYL